VIPLKDKPTNARIIIISDQFLEKAHKIVKKDAKNKDIDITFFLPKKFEIGPINNIPQAIKKVDTDKDKLLCKGVKKKILEKIGKIGCIEYKIEKVEKPLKNKEIITL
jgi:hypothetical protein